MTTRHTKHSLIILLIVFLTLLVSITIIVSNMIAYTHPENSIGVVVVISYLSLFAIGIIIECACDTIHRIERAREVSSTVNEKEKSSDLSDED